MATCLRWSARLGSSSLLCTDAEVEEEEEEEEVVGGAEDADGGGYTNRRPSPPSTPTPTPALRGESVGLSLGLSTFSQVSDKF